ncbi:MAG: GGDEF domain-containing protein, partial [Burkholderiaceae bacterium]|nr:GGDEF domain-containing protein [Burkholderiaceae bacterium]
AGDALICLAAKTLREIAREVDVVARLGGDEFGLLAVECDSAGADLLLHRMRDAFTRRNVRASVGYSMRTPGTGLTGAWQTADTNMYAAKQAKKNPLPGTE